MTEVERDAIAWHIRGGHVGLKWVARKKLMPDGREVWDAVMVPVEETLEGGENELLKEEANK